MNFVVATLFFAAASLAASFDHLSAQPHLQCAACLAVAEHVGHKMNESAKLKSTFQASHRLDARNKVKRIDYESSELRAHEILDGLCAEMEKEYSFRFGENGLRVFSRNKSLERADFYGKNDRKELRSISKRLKDICMEITEEQDNVVIALIKQVRDLDALEHGLCFANGFKCCGTKKAEASREKERDRRAKWLELRKIKDEKRKKKEERAKLKKEAEEKAKRDAEEAKREADALNQQAQESQSQEVTGTTESVGDVGSVERDL